MLFAWFRRWREAREKRRQEAARLVYQFWDGEQHRRVDPFRVWRAMQSDPLFDIVKHGPDMDRGSEPETTNGLRAICNAFGVKLYNESTQSGLTDLELMNLLADFCLWLDELKKKSSPLPKSSAPTDGAYSSAPEPQPSPTNSFSGSGSAGIESPVESGSSK